ncbi:hypothetical protein BC939DRAFT_451324 [Gamsiella multidivaricata]|uniref:uncharacterized protein n=1 Tax=Gamsiella multidivaricata TaxID=101098 RepID=UPI002221229D|nr:uncharacterized protein BC939DRAFT_451324 [Gamsiella multidivaricata]KAI7823545.1 hypothetical protein BC939DRAFT_451324 [Gamsiella multidivaricata]
MFSRLAARVIHTVMFIIVAGTCACLYAELIITSKVKKAEGSHYDFSWLSYYLLIISKCLFLKLQTDLDPEWQSRRKIIMQPIIFSKPASASRIF